MLNRITRKTSLAKIIHEVHDQFGVPLSTADAREIRNAAKNGTLSWGSSRIVITESSYISQISAYRVKEASGATYTAQEWFDTHGEQPC